MRIDWEVNTDPIRAVKQVVDDVKNGVALIYYSGPHSGNDEPTPVGVLESDWSTIEDLPRNFRGEVIASGPFFKAGQYNEAVIGMLRKKPAGQDTDGQSATAVSSKAE